MPLPCSKNFSAVIRDSVTAVLRTLQRRMRQWHAKFGAEREVYFAQEHPPGRQCL